VKQRLYRLLLPEAILNPPVSWVGEGFCGKSIEQQFIPYTYPMEGYPEIKMFYRYGGSFMGTMTETNKWVLAYQSPKLECLVTQDCWWSTETGLADIILPACTNFEREDICELGAPGGYGANNLGANHRVIIYQHKCIEAVGESKSDYDIYVELADRLGFKEKYTEGNSMEDWIRKIFNKSSLPKYVTYDEFKKKGYFVIDGAAVSEDRLLEIVLEAGGEDVRRRWKPGIKHVGVDDLCAAVETVELDAHRLEKRASVVTAVARPE
jgi:trimethylamine-N-oxide reductase (cytochrome c)